MKKLFAASLIAFGIYSTWWDQVKAAEIEAELHPVWVTGYCLKGTTASGDQTRPGICAYRPCDIGKTAIVYTDDRELIGVYEIKDTGDYNIQKGYVLDIWCYTKDECNKMTQKALIQIVDANG
jgi:hypothetical protein